MHIRKRIGGFSVLVGFALFVWAPSGAEAQGYVIEPGAGWQNTTGVGGSGVGPGEKVAPAGMALRAIEYAEDQNVPCYFRFTWWGLDGSGSPQSDDSVWESFRSCEQRRKRSIDVGGNAQVPRAFRLLRVCSRKSNDRIKGLRARGANITASGAQRDNGLLKEHDRPNCNDNWSPRVSQCPNGQAITRVRVESAEAGIYNTRGAVGISIFCSRVRLSS